MVSDLAPPPEPGDLAAVSDPARLAALHRLDLLDTPPEEAFDRLIGLVRRLLGVPVAHFAVVDRDRQFYKSQAGLPEPLATAREMPLSHSLCKHVVATGRPLAVSDARAHPVVCDSPAVLEFGVAAYLGVPIRSPDGHVLGSLCAIDGQPRVWTPDDEAVLCSLVAAVEGEIALRASEAWAKRLALVAAHATSGVIITDSERRVEWVNPALERMSGYALGELVGQTPGPLLTCSESEPEAVATIEDAYRRRVPFAVELWDARKDGSPFRVSVEGQPLHDDGGAFAGYMAVLTDVTEERAARDALQASEARYRTVVETIRDVVFQIGADGRWAYLNPAWEAITGFPVEESLGRACTEFIHPDDLPHHAEQCGRLFSGTAPFVRAELRFLTKGGGTRWVEVHAQPLRDEAGDVAGATGTITDITDTVRFEAEREAREKVEEMLRLKGAFLNNMSHELRTPLTGILGFAEILAEEVAEEHREPAAIIVRSGRRLMDTLNSVLDLAQLESGSVTPHLRPVDVHAEAADAVALLRPLADAKGLGLTLAGETAPALIDRTALHRVLNNLVGNAIKFTERGGVAVEVHAEGAHVRLRVADTGIGIAPAFLPHLFDEFKQASEGYARTHEGNGLGLAITRRLVELMGGEIAVESTPGVGSAFTVTLPAALPPGPCGAGDGAAVAAVVAVS